jgi:hypothetical protein
MTTPKKSDHIIVAVHITERAIQASLVQSILTEYGSGIKTRIGLHEPTTEGVSPNGVIVLEFVGPHSKCDTLIEALNAITGVEAKHIIFEH